MDRDWSLALEEDLARETSTAACEQAFIWSVSSSPWTVSSSFPSGQRGQGDTTTTGNRPYDALKPSTEMQEREVQTEVWTEEKEVNTENDWESMMRSVDEYSAALALQYETLLKRQEVEQVEHGYHVNNLEQKKEERKRQYQVLIDKIESLHVKLELNSCKTTRKNFTIKRQELSAEKERLEEERRRLAQELEDTERKLMLLIEEQNQEKLTWEREIADLSGDLERLCKQAEEANQAALQDEVAALEMQREMAVSQVEDWIAETQRFLDTLRFDPSQQHLHRRLEWEKNLAVVRSSLGALQNQFNENLRLLRHGQQLESLPPVQLPPLPHIPTLDLLMSPMMFPMHFSQLPPPPSVAQPFPPKFHPSSIAPVRVTPPPAAPSPQPPPMPPPHSTMPSHHGVPNAGLSMPVTHSLPAHHAAMPKTHIAMPPPRMAMAAPHTAIKTAHAPMPPAHASMPPAHAPMPPAHAPMPPPQPLPSNAPPAGKLDKLLEKLGILFPQCTRAQLMSVLQQIKTARGTMAGMSMDDVAQQVALTLERPPLGPIGPPSGARAFPSAAAPIQRPSAQVQQPALPPQRPAVAQVFPTRPLQAVAAPSRKLCLMCQNHVEPGSQYNMSCSHTLHKECISVWLASSKNNSCPFCPTK